MTRLARWPWIVLGLLGFTPFVILIALGFAWLWQFPWEVRLAVTLGFLAFWSAAALLSWRLQAQGKLLPKPEPPSQFTYTDRDLEALKLVAKRAEMALQEDPKKFLELKTYQETGLQMAQELAQFYHPGARDPVANLTVLEVLAIIELAAGDLWDLLDKKLPGSHLLTIGHWRQLPNLLDFYKSVLPYYWAAMAVADPLGTSLRYLASRLGIGYALEKAKSNIVVWFYIHFLYRLGHYLIEVNSGRLKVGARRYRELVAAARQPIVKPSDLSKTKPVIEPIPVQITVLGRVKAGKSSLINALLGERRAATDVLPLTREITRYNLQFGATGDSLTILDTVGYGNEGPRKDQLQETFKAAKDSDILLLVMNAREPGCQADVQILKEVDAYFQDNPSLRKPILVVVLTHIDLLPPSLEWRPPYNFEQPHTAKEKNVAEACRFVREALGDSVMVIPVCTHPDHTYGVKEQLLPLLVSLLSEGKAIALLRILKNEPNQDTIIKVLIQLWEAGRKTLRAAVGQKPQPPSIEGQDQL